MKNIHEFLKTNYPKAIELKKKFKILEKKEWDSITVLAELNVQLSHLYNVLYPSELINEAERNISKIGDEISDVLLQLSYLAYLEKINLNNIKKYEDYTYDQITGLSVLLGQLTERILEKYEYRFDKNRPGFPTAKSFIEDRILKMFVIIDNYAVNNNIDINKEFKYMYEDATSFIEKRINN